MRLEPHRQLPRLEAALAGARHHVVQLQARGAEQLPRDVELYPRCRLELRILVVAQVHLLVAPGISHHAPAVARQIGAVDDQGADRALARRLFELVGPASVIGHDARVEEFRILRRRLVDDHQQHLAFDVHALEIVPAVFRRLDAIADEDDGRVDVDPGGLGLVVGHVVIAELQIQRTAVFRLQGGSRRRQCVHAGEFDLLQVAAAVPRRFQAVEREFRGDVLCRNVAAPRTGPAALEQVIRQKAHVRTNALGIDAPHGGRHVDGKPEFRGRVRARPCTGGQPRGNTQDERGRRERLHCSLPVDEMRKITASRAPQQVSSARLPSPRRRSVTPK